MQKKWLFLAGGAVFVSVAASIIIWKWDFKKKSTEPINPVVQENTSTSEKHLMWDDPAGFTFDYPEGVAIDKHDEDQENYAHVELTHPQHQGKILV